MGKTVSNLHAKSHRASFIIKQMVGTPLYAYAYTRRKTAEDSKTKKIDLKDNFWGVCREKKPWGILSRNFTESFIPIVQVEKVLLKKKERNMLRKLTMFEVS